MKHQISTRITIDARPEQVWKVLMDFQNYPDWNPFVTSISGTPKVGEQLEASIDGMKMKPVVIEANNNQKFSWLGSLFFKGLFDGHHQFELIEHENGSTIFIHSESFSGILVRLFKKKLDTDIKKGFEAMNEALKRYLITGA